MFTSTLGYVHSLFRMSLQTQRIEIYKTYLQHPRGKTVVEAFPVMIPTGFNPEDMGPNKYPPRWWFQIFFYVHPYPWGNDPI